MTIGTIILIVALVTVLLVVLTSYVKAPPDRAFIISGLGRNPKILIGRAGLKLPVLERIDKLYLGQMSVDIKTEQSVPTNDFINVNVDAVAKVRIEPSQEGIQLAAKNFLNKNPEQIAKDPEYQKELAELGLKPSYMAAEEYSQEVHGIFRTIQDILK